MKSIDILVKVDEIYNILKSLLATGYWSRYEFGIGRSKLLLGPDLKFPCIYYAPVLLRGRNSSPCHNFLLTIFYKI